MALTTGLVVVEAVFGIQSHSTGLVADAGHNLTDAGALALSLAAVRLTLRPRRPERSFGNHRATILAALANAAVIAAVTAGIVFESVRRLDHPEHVHAGIVVAVAAGAFLVNGMATLVLRDGSHDLNMQAAVLHMMGDALGSLAVLIAAAVLSAVPSATWLDPASARSTTCTCGACPARYESSPPTWYWTVTPPSKKPKWSGTG
jgi:cobalt-zinc-cadmium efflux system protein